MRIPSPGADNFLRTRIHQPYGGRSIGRGQGLSLRKLKLESKKTQNYKNPGEKNPQA